METARYVIAVLMVVLVPPALLLWFFIHPAATFWRKLGPGWTYGLLGPPMVALMVWTYLERSLVIGADYGTELWPVIIGVALFGVSVWIGIKRKRHLTFAILAGLPELSKKDEPGKLLTEGIYGRIRHPRYVEVTIGLFGYALFTNYFGVYVLAALSVPVLFLIVVLEEQELNQRFGADYAAYCARVPRFLPRLHSKSNGDADKDNRSGDSP